MSVTSQPAKKVSVAVRGSSKSVMKLVEDRNSQIRHGENSEVYWKSLGPNVRREPCDCNACVLVSVIDDYTSR